MQIENITIIVFVIIIIILIIIIGLYASGEIVPFVTNCPNSTPRRTLTPRGIGTAAYHRRMKNGFTTTTPISTPQPPQTIPIPISTPQPTPQPTQPQQPPQPTQPQQPPIMLPIITN